MKKFDTDKALSEILDLHGAFFAFSEAQLKEKMICCVRYATAGAGLIIPVAMRQSFDEQYSALTRKKYEYELANNAARDIIAYELSNHESYYTGEIEDAVDALKPYGFTVEQVLKVYNEERVKEENYA